ncbi:hypothetical protein ADK60_08720 [Streptomyces sp. XY431]|nr:hypothetical protein ADK60_08720 [Streptomyces sp. XY431]
MLIRGFKENRELIREIERIAGTTARISKLDEVNQREWDALITDEVGLVDSSSYRLRRPLAPHLSVLVLFPSATSGKIERSLHLVGDHISRELQRARGLPESIATLVHEQLEPLLAPRATHQYLYTSAPLSGGSAGVPGLPPVQAEPFILSAAGKVLAGRYKRSDTSECWLVPKETSDPVQWVKVALGEWHHLDPSRFPGLPQWSHTSQWMTARERAIHEDLRQLNVDRDEYLRQAALRETEFKTQLAQAREDADGYERALLTAQGDVLKDAVLKALTFLGFTVTDADLTAKPDEHLEDLRIEDPDAPGWIVLAEVKGFTKGAKTEGIVQLLRANNRYTKASGGTPPSGAGWYIVNYFLNRDPGTRPQVLHGSGDVDSFAQDNGLTLSTVELFRLVTRVEEEVMTPAAARELLRRSTGRFAIAADTEEQADPVESAVSGGPS